MNDKTFFKIIIAIAVIGVLTTGILIGYTIELRNNCSIITYIANE